MAAMTAPPPAPIGLSGSEIALWKRCPREWYVTYYLGYLLADPPPTGSANIGTRIHTALEGHYGYGLDPQVTIDVLYTAEIAAHPEFEKDLRDDWELSKIMIAGYLDWVDSGECEPPDKDIEVIQTEAEVRVPLPGFEGVVDLRGKMDQVGLIRSTGLLTFIDYKTADNFEREDVLDSDPQMRTYSLIQWLASGQPPPMAGYPVIINENVPLVLGGMISTLRRVKRTSRSKPPYYSRRAFRHTPENMAAHLLSIQQVASEILAARAKFDAAYRDGGDMIHINGLQLTVARPNWMGHDCKWSCPFSSGLCQLMNGGMAWAEALVSSGRYVQGDPYQRYTRGGISAIADQLPQQAG
jgi:RecB family exonuclease